MSTHQLSIDHFNHVSFVTGPPVPTDPLEMSRSVMESSESSEFRSDLGDHRHNLFFLRRWLNFKNLLEDICLKHEIEHLFLWIKVTAPVLVAGKKSKIVFSMVPSKHLPFEIFSLLHELL